MNLLLKRPVPLWVLLVLLPLVFGIGGAVGRLALSVEEDVSAVVSETRESRGRLTSPLLECEIYQNQGPRALHPFRYKVEKLINEKIAAGELLEASVYFRDMSNGMWFGINENLAYRPASMLKVVIMIACFKLAEQQPSLLKETLLYTGDFDLTERQGYRPSSRLEPGKRYTVEDLLFRMIAQSDNNASQLLVGRLGQPVLDGTIRDLHVNFNPEDRDHMITAHAYGGFFRILYNASYLSREYSEKALQLLANSEFREGIRAGFPSSVQSAAKFGEWSEGQDGDVVQAHEFALIYYPGRPYLLGIMTRGHRGEYYFKSVLAEISRLVYEEVDQQQRQGLMPAR